MARCGLRSAIVPQLQLTIHRGMRVRNYCMYTNYETSDKDHWIVTYFRTEGQLKVIYSHVVAHDTVVSVDKSQIPLRRLPRNFPVVTVRVTVSILFPQTVREIVSKFN